MLAVLGRKESYHEWVMSNLLAFDSCWEVDISFFNYLSLVSKKMTEGIGTPGGIKINDFSTPTCMSFLAPLQASPMLFTSSIKGLDKTSMH